MNECTIWLPDCPDLYFHQWFYIKIIQVQSIDSLFYLSSIYWHTICLRVIAIISKDSLIAITVIDYRIWQSYLSAIKLDARLISDVRLQQNCSQQNCSQRSPIESCSWWGIRNTYPCFDQVKRPCFDWAWIQRYRWVSLKVLSDNFCLLKFTANITVFGWLMIRCNHVTTENLVQGWINFYILLVLTYVINSLHNSM